MARPARNTFFWLALVAAVTALVASLICLSDPHATPLYMLDIFTVPILMLSLVPVAVLLLFRQGLPALVALIASGLLLAAAWPQIAPRTPIAASGSPKTRIVFANMYFRNDHPERLADWAMAQRADIIVTAETTPFIWDALDASLHARYPYRRQSGEIAVFSRWPLTPLAHTGWHFAALRVATPAGAMNLIGAHFDHPDSRQSARSEPFIDRLQGLIDRTGTDQTVIVGDFNSNMSGYMLKDMARNNRLNALPALIGTWPSPLPGPLRLSLDNAFAGDAWSLSQRAIGPDIGSDHRPIAFTIGKAKN